MDSLTSSIENSTISSTVNFTVYENIPVTAQCRHRAGYHSNVTFNIITCAFCFTYVYTNSSVSVDPSTFELVTGNNEVYAKGTRMTADQDKPESVSIVCGSLQKPSECWKWQNCCRQARTCCQKQIAESHKHSIDKESLTCSRTWDGYACWPETPAGQRPYIPCPAYVPEANTDRYAYKTCTQNGTWYKNPMSNKEWTDYTDCSSNEHYRRLYHAGLACNIITIVLLLPACIIFLSYKPLRQQHRIKIHLCLMVSSFMTSLCLLLWDAIIFKDMLGSREGLDEALAKHSIGCRLLLMLIRYSEIASFMWMFIEGFHLHRLLVHAFSVPKTLIPYYIFGFGFPLLPVIVYAVIRVTNLKSDQKCWIKHDQEAYEWIIAAPSLATLAANVFFLLRIVFIMVRQLEPHPNEPSNFRRAVKAVVVLVPLFGIQFLLFVYRPQITGDFPQTFELLGKICSSLQGSFIVIVFCYLNKEVQGHLKTSCMRLMRQTAPQDVNSRTYTVTTHLPTDSSRNRISNGSNDSSHVILLRPVYQYSNPEIENTRKVEENITNCDLSTIPENLEEGLLLNSTKYR